MNTTPETPESGDTSPNFFSLKGDPSVELTDAAKAQLERELQEEKDARSEERFVWIIVSIILVDVLWFRNSPNPVLPVVVLVLEVLVLFVLARRLGLERLEALFERVIHGIGRGTSGQ